MSLYISNGQQYFVKDEDFEAFAEEHPNATDPNGIPASQAYENRQLQIMQFDKEERAKKVKKALEDHAKSQEKDTWLERTFGKTEITDFAGDLYRAARQGIAQGKTVDEAFDVFKKGKDISEEDLKAFVEINKELETYGPSDEMRQYEKIKEEAGGGVWGFIKGMAATRGAVIPQIIVSSMASLITTAFDSEEAAGTAAASAGAGAAAGAAVGASGAAFTAGISVAAGAKLGALSGFVGGLTGSMETALTLTELLKEKLDGKEFNEENIRDILDDDEAFDSVKNKAVARGVAIGAIEGITAGLSRGVATNLAKAGKSTGKIARRTTALEMSGGMGGEFAGQVAAGQEVDTAEILMEGIAEAKGVVNVSDILLTNKRVYEVNGETRKNGRKEINKILDDVESGKISEEDAAKMAGKLKATNDKNLQDRINRVIGDAELKSQIDARVEGEDRTTLVDLEKKKAQAEADAKKKGIFAKPGAKKTLENIEKQINEIIGKYEGVTETDADFKAGIQERKKLAQEVRSIRLEKTKNFAKVSSEALGFDPFESFKENGDFVARVVERIMSQEQYTFDGVEVDLTKMTEEQINAEAQRIADSANNADAVNIPTAEGNQAIAINEEAAYKYGALDAGSHEVLHGVLRGTLSKMDIDTRKAVIADFKIEVGKNLGENVVQLIENRLKENYGDSIDLLTTDEWFTGLSDIIADENNNITFENNKGFFNGIKDKVASLFNKETPYKNLSISTGQDAFNFIKEYSKNVKEGGLSEAMINFAKKGAATVVQAGEQELTGGTTSKADAAAKRKEKQKEKKTKETKVTSENKRLQSLEETLTKKQKETVASFRKKGISKKVTDNYIKNKSKENAKGVELSEKYKAEDILANPENYSEAIVVNAMRHTQDGGPIDTGGSETLTEKLLTEIKQDIKDGISINSATYANKDLKKATRRAYEAVQQSLDKKPKTKPTTEPGAKFSKSASDKVQKIYNEKGVSGAFDIINEFKPIVSKIVERRSQAPNFDRQLLTDEIETGKRGILDLIRAYNPDKGVPLAAYINQNLPNRAIEASRRVLGEEFTQDVTEAKTVEAEQAAEVDVAAKPKPKKIVLAERLGIKDKVSKAIEKIVPSLEISKLNFKNLKNRVPEITGELFGISSKKIQNLANLTKKELQAAQMFINKNADLLINVLPEGATAGGTATGVPNTLLKAFYTKTDRAKMAKTGSAAGLAVQQKNKINRSEFLETFGIVDGKPSRTDRNTSARVLALANLTGKMITNQAVRIELAKTKVNEKAINKIAEGKSQAMFSKSYRKFNIKGTIDSVLNSHIKKVGGKTFQFRTEEDVDIYVQALKQDVLPLMPRDFWFGLPDKNGVYGTEFTPSNRAVQNKDIYNYYVKEIKALRNLPDTAFGKPVDGVKDYSRPSYKSLFENKKGVQIDKIKQTNERSAKIHEALWSRIYDAVQKNPTKARAISNFFKLVSKKNNHWHRFGAQMVGYTKNPKGDGKKLYEYEHAMPATASYLYLMDAALNGYDFNSTYRPVMDNFKLIALDAADNKKLSKAGLATSMPENWNVVDNKWWQRYFNSKVVEFDGGIDPNSIMDLQGKTFSDKFNINAEGSAKFSKTGTTKFKTLDKAVLFSRSNKNKTKGITVLDFDDTLATTESLVKYTTPDGKTGTLNAEQFASTYEDLQDQGYTFDFSDFNKVVKGKLAPLFQKALKLQGKFGPENMFVLTARPPAAQKAIFDFLKANGLNIPLKNITGLGNSTSEAKALWMADKVAEGYNDFYFADDALQNVQAVKNMLDQFDVKSKVQQAKVKFSKSMNKKFNDILEQSTGVESEQVFSKAEAKLKGRKGRYASIIPPSAQDFMGLLYNFVGKGKLGEQQIEFFKKALVDPFARGIKELNTKRQKAAEDLQKLLKDFKNIKKNLNKKIEGTEYTYDQAVRVYLWNKAGFEVPGMTQKDVNALDSIVKNNPELQAFADTLGLISKREQGYSQPNSYWLAENLKSDILSDGSIGDSRAVFLNEFIENAKEIFSEENLNKIEAIYGSKFREALQDVLYRMETGRSRPVRGGRLMNTYMNWVNNSVGAIMFFNLRSAVLQTISAINYINWSDNNPLKAAAAFANQKQYWKDFTFLFNSDYLKQRRAGNQRGINEAEISEAVAGSDNKAKAAIAWLLQKGFLPTQIADSFAIASGGATFYRNRIKSLMKEGMTQQEAEKQAFLDFQESTEESQQSARPDKISQQQASPLGRLILSFQNTPMQYARIMNKAARDLIAGRGDAKTHISKIIYYSTIQGIIFGALQSAIFAALGEDKEEEFDKKKDRILNQMLDSVLSGIGYGGKAISTAKNTVMEFLKQKDKGFMADHAYTLLQALSFSPPIGSKLRKIYSSIQTDKYNEGVFSERGFTLDNPIWSALGNVVEGVTNIPLGRLANKMLNVDNALDSNNETWQRIALLLGWNTWDLGIKDKDIEGVKKKVKKQRREEKKQKKKEKVEEKNKKVIEKNKKKKDGRCAAISRGGERCKNDAINDGFCSVHEKVKQRKDGKEVQCKKIKKDGKRCKMKTSNQSGLCYYHD